MRLQLITAMTLTCMLTSPAIADWGFSSTPAPNASIQTNNMTLELQCDRIRFAPAGYEDSEDIVKRQGLSIRFLKNGSTEVGAFQIGPENASVQIVDNYPVEILFRNAEDYNFVLDQISENAIVNLSMVDQDVSYGLFDLKGSGTAIKSLRTSCSGSASKVETTAGASNEMEAPEGVVYCGGGGIKRQIEYMILENSGDQWDVRVTVNGETQKAMTAYSYFGNSQPPKGFVVALLGEDRSEFLVFRDGGKDWLELGDYQYSKCN